MLEGLSDVFAAIVGNLELMRTRSGGRSGYISKAEAAARRGIALLEELKGLSMRAPYAEGEAPRKAPAAPRGGELQRHINRIGLYYVRENTVPYSGTVTDPVTVYEVFGHMAKEPREKFVAVLLNSRKKVLAYDEIATGTLDEAVVYPQEVVRSALLAAANSVILVHNHPSGDAAPSSHDARLTRDIKSTCGLFGIELCDHVIICRDGFYSFASAGRL
jgi:proteasome lid subunit RPN8/RPN11